jgi:hypothetical protein
LADLTDLVESRYEMAAFSHRRQIPLCRAIFIEDGQPWYGTLDIGNPEAVQRAEAGGDDFDLWARNG